MLQLSYTSSVSVTPFAESVWVVAQTNLDDLHQTGQIILLGYATQADVGVSQPIGFKNYPITPALYKQYYSGAVDHVASGYALAQATADVVVTPASADGKTPAVMASMFANAAPVVQDAVVSPISAIP